MWALNNFDISMAALKWPKLTSPTNNIGKAATNQLRAKQKDDEKLIKSLTFDQIEIEFRNRVCFCALDVFM